MKRKKKSQKKEIVWNVVNSALAALLVLAGAFTTGDITTKSIIAATGAGLVVALSQFKNYWQREEKEYCVKIFGFVGA